MSELIQLNDNAVKLLMYLSKDSEIQVMRRVCKNWKHIHNKHHAYLYKQRIYETEFYKQYLINNQYSVERLSGMFNGQWDRMYTFVNNLCVEYLNQAVLRSNNGYVIYHNTHVMYVMFNILNKTKNSNVLLVNETDSFYFTTSEIYSKACQEVIRMIFRKISDPGVYVDEIFRYLTYFQQKEIPSTAIKKIHVGEHSLEKQYKNKMQGKSDTGSWFGIFG